MTSPKFDVAIIGAGPAGLAAAKQAGKDGARVALISQEKPGGRALWHSLVPSKVWLHAAEHGAHRPDGIQNELERVQQHQFQQDQTELERVGVDMILGQASFIDNTTLKIQKENEETQISATRIIITAGSVPIFFPTLKPDGERIIAPRMLGKLHQIPKSIIVVGGGVTGSEMIYMFNRLGSQVNAITDLDQLLPRSDRDVSDELESILSSRGVAFIKNKRVENVTNTGDNVSVTLADKTELSAEMAFIAIGRQPDLKPLQLQKTDIEYGAIGITVDQTCRTSVPSIYAAGDVTGAPMTANRAMAMGRIAALNAVHDSEKPFQSHLSIEAVYTEPEVVQVGDMLDSSDAEMHRADFSSLLKAKILQKDGFIKVKIRKSDGVIVGAAGIGLHASDILAPLAVAIQAGKTLNQLQDIAFANPTLSEILGKL